MTNLNKDTEFTYLGHSTFRIKSPGGKTIIIDPWVHNNPACPENLKNVDELDIMVLTHAHFDHIGDAVPLGQKHSPKVVGIFETCVWLENRGLTNTFAMNKGGTQDMDGIKFTMVHADHSCGILEEDGTISYGGEPVGYIIEFENGFRVYHAGDTAVFSDMKLISEIYKPEVAFLPIGDLYTMSPLEASYACRFLNVKKVVPMHYGTFPSLTGTPDKLRELTKDISGLEIIDIKPGETLS